MADYTVPVRAEAFIFYCSLVSQADTKIYQSNPTLAAGDVQVSKDGGTLTNLATLPTVTPASGKLVKVSLSADEMTADNVAVVFSDAAGAQWCDFTVNIQTAARGVDDLAFPTTTGRSLDVTATGAAGIDLANVENQGSTLALSATTVGTVTALAAGAVNAAAIAAGAIDADAVAADAANEIADALLDRASAVDTYTVRQVLRVLAADAAGKSSGSLANAPVIRAIDDSKARITATVNSDGDRLTITVDAT